MREASRWSAGVEVEVDESRFLAIFKYVVSDWMRLCTMETNSGLYITSGLELMSSGTILSSNETTTSDPCCTQFPPFINQLTDNLLINRQVN